jgi:hypothetical protein
VALAQGDPKRAIAHFEHATKLDPGQESYRLNLEAAKRAANAVQE